MQIDERTRVKRIIDSLSDDERLVLYKIGNLRKSKKERIFSEDDLSWKVPESFDLNANLRSLESKSIIQRIDNGKHLWQVEMKEVEHQVKEEEALKGSGLSRILHRG